LLLLLLLLLLGKLSSFLTDAGWRSRLESLLGTTLLSRHLLAAFNGVLALRSLLLLVVPLLPAAEGHLVAASLILTAQLVVGACLVIVAGRKVIRSSSSTSGNGRNLLRITLGNEPFSSAALSALTVMLTALGQACVVGAIRSTARLLVLLTVTSS